jgi:hypothetical protein
MSKVGRLVRRLLRREARLISTLKGAPVLSVTDRPRTVSPFVALALTAIVGAALVVVSVTATPANAAATVHQSFILYSVTKEEQFLDHSDDRARGKGNNPFGNFKDSKTTTKEAGNGPFPGDNAVFSFGLYTDTALKTSVGSAIFTCTYNFNKHAFCDASYQLNGGVLLGAGAFDFNAGTFAIAVTGGTGKYASATGDISATPSGTHAQRLAFVLG